MANGGVVSGSKSNNHIKQTGNAVNECGFVCGNGLSSVTNNGEVQSSGSDNEIEQNAAADAHCRGVSVCIYSPANTATISGSGDRNHIGQSAIVTLDCDPLNFQFVECNQSVQSMMLG